MRSAMVSTRKISNVTLLGLGTGVLLATGACLFPVEASAKWVRVSVRATMDPGQEIYSSTGQQIVQPIYPSFILNNYNATSIINGTASWTQAANNWSYYPLFGFGTLVDTDGFYGDSYNARNTLTSSVDMFRFTNRLNANPTFTLNTGRANNATGYSLYPANNSVPKALSSVNLIGTIQNFNATNSNTDVTQFIASALGSNTSATYNCATTCTGLFNTEEDILSLTWNQITFEMIEATPSPLPIFGGAAAFTWARKLRRRTAASAQISQQKA